jgi:menaquinol-cytochrome c reductase iron-sulfur subunit
MTEPIPSRRWFLDALTSLLFAGIGLLMLIPALRYVLAPLWRKDGAVTFVDVGALTTIPIGDWRLVTLELVQADGWRKAKTRHAIWVRRTGDSDKEISVLSSTCPHLGCPVNWILDKSEFVCPCHGGLFDATGKLIGGPPPRNLDPLEFKVQAGNLLVRWQDFKIGVENRVPVSV